MYCSAVEFVKLFGEQEAVELTNLCDPCSTTIDEERLEQALTYSSAIIDGYIQNRVTLPLTALQIPETLKACCADIARYRLDRNRCREEVRIRYEDWISWLKDVSKGVVNLGLDSQDPPESPTAVPDSVYVTASDRVFTDENLRGFAGGLW
jgi:phage gp36-like protein